MLSCYCPDIDNCDWWYIAPHDFIVLDTKRRRRCCSCKNLIDIGANCVRLDRYRGPLTDIQEIICGDEIPLAPWWLCERCGEIYFNLDDIGYCYIAGDSLENNLKEYWDLTGFVPRLDECQNQSHNK